MLFNDGTGGDRLIGVIYATSKYAYFSLNSSEAILNNCP